MVNIRLKTELLKQGVSQIKLARKLGIDDGYLSNIIRGWKKPTNELQEKIANELGKPKSVLFSIKNGGSCE